MWLKLGGKGGGVFLFSRPGLQCKLVCRQEQWLPLGAGQQPLLGQQQQNSQGHWELGAVEGQKAWPAIFGPDWQSKVPTSPKSNCQSMSQACGYHIGLV